jgi:hypothetical protein
MPTISGARYESRELSQAGAHRLDAVVRSICYSAHQGLHASSLRKQASLSGGEHTVNLRHDGGTLPYRRRDTLGRTRPHIADGKNAGPAGLKRQDRAGIGASPASVTGPVITNPLLSTATQ